ncbi:MAG: glycosyltransferase family 2 protein [Candidatus Onthomorpha sp.]|nr:glycosyltransferase family 2 protein [Bacteroidales bacterium]MDY4584177.1 glycosyltransferase family 2 protein [Candidatus Onthomorpha sp.]MCI6644718.1 glycosyltransferase family 2 protein [Bacteroidales bacterium]MCI6800028.1 glycosyltransferase family 2 protein [Bacteroidales bacterium]MCI6900910.1 glycosyltransferase family 2 protein [Bacteroidales bacterium]
MEISAIIPSYNEQDNVGLMYERMTKTLSKISPDYEIIYINDCSKDQTLLRIKELAAKDTHVKYLSFSRNFGHQIAVSAGLDYCSGKAVVIIDGDLQDPPELIEQMYEKYKEGYKVVYARRTSREGETWFKKATAKIFYRLLASMTSIDIPVDVGDFRLIDQVIVKHLRNMPEKSKYIRGQISWIGYKQTFVNYHRDARIYGKTNYPLRKMLRFALDGITAFSDKPLKIASGLGIVAAIVSLLALVYALVAHFCFNSTITGWTSLILSVLFIGGVQLITIGIIGEYIARINNDVRNRPLYILEENNMEEQA